MTTNSQPPRHTYALTDKDFLVRTCGYATMVHDRGCNPHRCTTTFANVEITSFMTS